MNLYHAIIPSLVASRAAHRGNGFCYVAKVHLHCFESMNGELDDLITYVDCHGFFEMDEYVVHHCKSCLSVHFYFVWNLYEVIMVINLLVFLCIWP